MIAAESSFGCADPLWFWLLVVLPIVCWWSHRRRPALPFAGAELLGEGRLGCGPLPRSWRRRFAWLPAALEALALGLLVLALARPVQRLPLPPERLGIDVLLCIDTSSSMAAKDLAAGRTRHSVGLELAGEFVKVRRDDRVGCVTFARYPDLRCPPTLDHAALAELLGGIALVGKDSPEDATGIGAAVARAAAVLARSEARGKVIVLLTDGEENVATAATPEEIAPLHAAQLCARLGVRVHGVVLGQGNQKPDGRFVPLDTTAVQQLAAETGGRFFAARDAAALQQVYASIDALEKVAFAEPRVLVREWFPAPLGLSVLLLALARTAARRWFSVVP